MKKARQLSPQPPPGKDGQAAAESASAPSRWRRSSEAPGPFGPAGDAARSHAAPLPSAGAAQLARIRALPGAPGACVPDLPAPWPLPAAAGVMALPGTRARGWAAAAKMAQRRRHAEAARGSPSRASQGSRAALYVHVSGAGAELAGRGGGGSESTWRLIAQGSRFCLSRPAEEVSDGTRYHGKEIPWIGDLKSLVLTSSVTLTE